MVLTGNGESGFDSGEGALKTGAFVKIDPKIKILIFFTYFIEFVIC